MYVLYKIILSQKKMQGPAFKIEKRNHFVLEKKNENALIPNHFLNTDICE